MPASASSKAAPDLKFERPDWTSFRTVEGLQQKAGVRADLLRRLILKELADNALDAGANVRVGGLPGGGYFVEDDGAGIEGSPEDIARLFSISRPMVSTKLLRLPTRGALGNGLRVIAGAVLVSEGSLTVVTRGRRIGLAPQRDGSTAVLGVSAAKGSAGTRIEISLGAGLPADTHSLYWAQIAIEMRGGPAYAGRSSPFWYDVPQFHELLSASGDRPVRDLIAHLDGCTGAKAGEIVAMARLGRAVCGNITRDQAAKLLMFAREVAKPVSSSRLGGVGPEQFPTFAYAKVSDTCSFGSTEPFALIPFLAEAWATLSSDMALSVCVNRTPIAGSIKASRYKRDIDFFGCGLSNNITTAPKDQNFTIFLNITSPFMPITSDGKEPNLKPFVDQIADAVARAVRKATRPSGKDRRSIKDVVLDNLDDVIAAVSGEEGYRFNERQLFYALRPIVMEGTGQDLKIGNFKTIITDYESANGEIEGMYREPRGSITHPHRDETIPLGTLMVEEYGRPAWTFNKLVYIEKEGFSEALKAAGWMERHDCAVMSSKGFSTRAAKDLIDLLAEHDEPVQVFCVHDADASGTSIYQSLQEETKARGARKIQIINLGLEPWEAVEMGLDVETVESRAKKGVADYVLNRRDGARWARWLQTHRVELNAMTTPQFIEWLDDKMAEYGDGKLIPPPDVLEAELAKRVEEKVRTELTAQILREGNFESRVADAIADIKSPKGATLIEGVTTLFEREPERAWRDHIDEVLSAIGFDAGEAGSG